MPTLSDDSMVCNMSNRISQTIASNGLCYSMVYRHRQTRAQQHDNCWTEIEVIIMFDVQLYLNEMKSENFQHKIRYTQNKVSGTE